MPLKKEDYLVLFCDGKRYLVSLKEGFFHTHKGVIKLSELEGKEYGDCVFSSKGEKFHLLKPTLFDFLMKLRRETQIIYPKDIGFILVKLGISEGMKVLECGCGSGALTTALAFFVGEKGKVFSYEKEEKFIEVARENLKRLNLEGRVIFKHKEVLETFEEEEVDALFLDVKEPWKLIPGAYQSLKGGHPLGVLVPTTNQVSMVLKALEEYPFVDIEVLEILLRPYKTNPERLRPEDTMIAHTGYLIFAKKVLEK